MDNELFADSNKNVEWLNRLEWETNVYIGILKDRAGLETTRMDKNFECIIKQLQGLTVLIEATRTQLKAEDKLKPVNF